MFVIVVYCPNEFVEPIIAALSSCGAGCIGDYRGCAFTTQGEGRFEPLTGASPHVGVIGKVEKVKETKIEMVCEKRFVRQALDAMIAAHPYEEPAYHAYEVQTVKDFL